MSNVVQFLETLACNPKRLTPQELEMAIAESSMDPELQHALLSRDATELSEMIGGRTKMVCMIAPAENDEPQQDESEEGGEELPQREESRAA